MKTSALNRALAWGLLALALLGSAAGWALSLYQKFWFYDEILHFYSMFAYTLVAALYLYGLALTGARTHRLLLVLIIGGIGVSLGVVWEIAEWTYDEIVRPNVIRGKTDTMIDLVMDALGALLAGFVCLVMLDKAPR